MVADLVGLIFTGMVFLLRYINQLAFSGMPIAQQLLHTYLAGEALWMSRIK